MAYRYNGIPVYRYAVARKNWALRRNGTIPQKTKLALTLATHYVSAQLDKPAAHSTIILITMRTGPYYATVWPMQKVCTHRYRRVQSLSRGYDKSTTQCQYRIALSILVAAIGMNERNIFWRHFR